MLKAPGSMNMGDGAPRRGRGWRSPQAMAILGADLPPAYQHAPPSRGSSSFSQPGGSYWHVDQFSGDPNGAGLDPGGAPFQGDEPREGRSGVGDWFKQQTQRLWQTDGPELYDREREVVCGAMYNDERDAGVPYKDQLQYDLATSYYFSGDCFRDYGFFVANWHPLLGIFCSHPLHPWKKHERFLALIVSLALTMLVPAFFLSETRAQWSDNETKTGVFMFITLPAMLLEVALYWFAIGDSYCRGNPCCAPVAGLIVAIKSACFIVALVIAGFASFVIYVGLGGELPSKHMMQPFFTSRLHSWLLWFPVWLLMPCLGFWHYWTIEKRAMMQRKAQPMDVVP
mmetsp:Transcript_36957/g.73139  ORF Transcript_36957/g.73139 Transcript_36957/m.73139 type:complete len:341 (+) Transcript_36957:59-1081(+)